MAPLPGWQPLTNICDPLSDTAYDPATVTGHCGLAALLQLVKNGMTDLMIVSSLIVVVACIIAGFKLLASQGNPGAMTETKRMFGKIVTGFAVILLAWLIVYTLASTLLNTNFYFFLGK